MGAPSGGEGAEGGGGKDNISLLLLLLAALFFTVVVFSAITIIIIIVINATHTCHASKCAVPKYGSPPAVATNAEDGAV